MRELLQRALEVLDSYDAEEFAKGADLMADIRAELAKPELRNVTPAEDQVLRRALLRTGRGIMSGLKLSGYEYKQFIRADWDALLGVTEAYMDAQEITVNDANEPEDVNLIPDDAKVVIHSGCVLAEEVLDLSLISACLKWRKSLSTIVMTIEVPKESASLIKEMLKAHKMRVIS